MLLGYLNKKSFFVDEVISIKITTDYDKLNIKIFNYFHQDKYISIHPDIKGQKQNFPKNYFAIGCNWNTSLQFKIPNDWIPDLYIIELFITNTNWNFYIPFVIKSKNTNGNIKNLILMNTNTWEAYSDEGGASFYRYYKNKLGKTNYLFKNTSKIVSPNRPNSIISEEIKMKLANGREKLLKSESHLFIGECYLLDWMFKNNYSFDLITDEDMHFGYPYLNKYKNIILNCHPEYWNQTMYLIFLKFLKNGGNLISLAGNVIFRKVIINDNKQIIKDTKTIYWRLLEQGKNKKHAKKLKFPLPYKVIGSLYTPGGLYTFHPYKIINPHHWIFRNTGLRKGDLIGANCLNRGASGHETDKCVLDKKLVLARGTNPSKKGKQGGADIIFRNWGKSKIFSVGSITFTASLGVDKNIELIVKNVLNKYI